jgi:hypothetical protein
MINDPFPFFEYLTQSQLGQLFGATSHEVGRWLKELGFKRPDNRPSDEAMRSGIAANVTNGPVRFPAWNKEEVVKLLESNGHRRADSTEPEAPSRSDEVTLLGPFSARRSGEDGYELLDGNGKVGIWVRGEANAERVAALLSLAGDCGKLGRGRKYSTFL